MLKGFADLQIYTLESGGKNTADEYAYLLSLLGFRYVSFVCFNRVIENRFKEYRRRVEDYGLEYISRVDLEIKSLSQAKGFLRKYRKSVDLVVARPRNINAARFSARDGRIDMIFFDGRSPKFDTIQAKLMGVNNKVLEIAISEILTAEKRVPVIRKLNRTLTIALKYDVKIVLSSGAHNIYEIRTPRDMVSIIKTLLNIEYESGLEMMRENPFSVILRSREKRNKEFIMPGLKVIGKAKPYEAEKKILDFLS